MVLGVKPSLNLTHNDGVKSEMTVSYTKLILHLLVFSILVTAGDLNCAFAQQTNAGGLRIGVWVKPRQPGPQTIDQLESAIGSQLDYAMHYQPLAGVFPNEDEMDDRNHGRIPVVSVGCGSPVAVARGENDFALDRLAHAMAAYGSPVEIRYCWEMNAKYRDIDAQSFIAAWRHFHDRFVQAGVRNVRWYFCPGAEKRRAAGGLAYYPGDDYVDDIGVDVYDRQGEGFQAMFDMAYHTYDGIAKPFIIGETGAKGDQDQPTFLTGSTAMTLRRLYPKVVGILYFDAAGPHGDWSFTPEGLASFAAFVKAARN